MLCAKRLQHILIPWLLATYNVLIVASNRCHISMLAIGIKLKMELHEMYSY